MSTLPQQPPPPEQVNKFIQDLLPLERRENAMAELSRNRELIPELGILLWNTPGAVSALLQEVLFVYPVIFPPTMSSSQSTRVCNALALMQCVASNDETRPLFIKGIYSFVLMLSSAVTHVPLPFPQHFHQIPSV